MLKIYGYEVDSYPRTLANGLERSRQQALAAVPDETGSVKLMDDIIGGIAMEKKLGGEWSSPLGRAITHTKVLEDRGLHILMEERFMSAFAAQYHDPTKYRDAVAAYEKARVERNKVEINFRHQFPTPRVWAEKVADVAADTLAVALGTPIKPVNPGPSK